jgi:dipeptidase
MCDIFAALGSATADGSVLFGKDSDREPNEAQILEYHPHDPIPTGRPSRAPSGERTLRLTPVSKVLPLLPSCRTFFS